MTETGPAGQQPVLPAWYDDDAFWSAFELAMFTTQHFARAPDEVRDLLQLTGVEPGARVLDLCCGPGRHATELARRGYFVTGVDRNPSFLARARDAAGAKGLELELVEEDMRRFVRPCGFDLALNLYTSFGYFEDPADERQVLDNLCRSLDDRGLAVIDLMSKEILARVFVERSWERLPDGTLWLRQLQLAPDWRAVRARWLLVRPDGTRFEREALTRLYAATELVALLEGVGFAAVEVFGSLRGDPYDQQADRLVLVARKAGGPDCNGGER